MESSFYGNIPFPKGEEKCLTKGQMLTDRMMDYMAFLLFDKLKVDPTKYHLIPTFYSILTTDIDWTNYSNFEKVFMIMNHCNHWFLFVYDPKAHIFHLFDPLSCEENSPIDLELFPIADDDLIEDYYGKIPNQGESKTNCGILVLLYLIYLLIDKPIKFNSSSLHINKVVRPYFAKILRDTKLPLEFNLIV
jgi:hypothetical protein